MTNNPEKFVRAADCEEARRVLAAEISRLSSALGDATRQAERAVAERDALVAKEAREGAMNCATCANWLDKGPKRDMPPGFRMCGAAKMSDGEETAEGIPPAETMVVQDGSSYFAALYTRADHGCTAWRKISD